MEHDTEEGPSGYASDREEEWPGGDAGMPQTEKKNGLEEMHRYRRRAWGR